MPDTIKFEGDSLAPSSMHSDLKAESEETQVPYNPTASNESMSNISESLTPVVTTTKQDTKSISALTYEEDTGKLPSLSSSIDLNSKDLKQQSRIALTSDLYDDSQSSDANQSDTIKDKKTSEDTVTNNIISTHETKLDAEESNDSLTNTTNIDNKLANLNIHDGPTTLNSRAANSIKNKESTETMEIQDHRIVQNSSSNISLENVKITHRSPKAQTDPVNDNANDYLKSRINDNNTNVNVYMENSTTPHASTSTLTQQTQQTQQTQVPPNSLNLHNMISVLSQSTGQEERFSDLNNPHVSTKTDSNQSGLPDEPKVQMPRSNHFKDPESSGIISTSGVSTVTNQDSLIFQQSGLTLYNFNSQSSTNNLNQHPINHYTLPRNVSQQSLKRQESYLTFKAPDNLRKNLQSSLSNDVPNSKGNQPSDVSLTQEVKTSSNKRQQELKQNNTNIVKDSLLSQQKKKQENEERIQNVLDIDLSSYLSAQEPEIDSRTQQKLWLQRENVATLNDSEDTQHAPTAIINQSTRFQYEQHSREFLHIRRYMNPMLDSLNRIKDSGVGKRRLSIDNGNMEASSLLAKSARETSGKSKFQSASLAKSIGLVKDNKVPEPVFENDLTDYKEIIKAMWNKNCDEFKGEKHDSPHKSNSSTSSNIIQQYQINQGRLPTNGASPHYNYPTSTPFARGNNTSFGQVNSHSLNTSSTRR